MTIPYNPPFLLAAILVALISHLSAQERPFDPSPHKSAGKPADNGSKTTLKYAVPGPWGKLEYYPLFIEPPDDYLRSQPSWNSHLTGTVWAFHNQSLDQVRATLNETGLSPAIIDGLVASAVDEPDTSRISITVPEDVIISLSPVTRERLYQKIGDPNGPDPFSKPFGIDPLGFQVMAEGSQLSPESISLISALTYTRSGRTLFSDIALVSARQPGEAGRLILFGTLFRTPSLVVRLRLEPGSDLSGIAGYWSTGGRKKDVQTLLNSFGSAADSIDLVHLLPPTPRMLLNTFPGRMMSLGRTFPDCFWTAMNFLSEEPSDRYLDAQWLGRWLAESYEEVQHPLQFGDVILFTDAGDGTALHACNYVADDLVFTKNGRSLLKPWTLQSLDDLLNHYQTEQGITVSIFRKRL